MRWFLGVLLVLGLAVAFLPLRLATGYLAPGLAAAEIGGSIWKGRLRDARYNGVPLGDLDVGLDPRRLLGGEASLSFTRFGPRLEGRVGGTRADRRIEGLTGEVAVAVLPAPMPAALIGFEGASARFDPAGTCLAAGGTVSARLAGLPLLDRIPPLTATARCDEGALHAPLAAPEGQVGLDLWLWGDGRWRAVLGIAAPNPLAQMALAAAGFEMTQEGAIYRVDGRMRAPAGTA